MITNRRSRSMFLVGTILGLLVCLAVQVRAQQATATISGTVTDPSGSAIPEATVSVTNVGTGARQTVVSDVQGRYKIADLPVGDYEVQTAKAGFQTVIRKGVKLNIGGETVVDFGVPIGQVAQTVTVEGEVSQVETTSSQISNLVEQTQIRELPLNGRNFEQLVLLAPGVVTFTNFSKGTFYGAGNGFSVSGSRPNGQAELLDDTDVMDYMNRGSGAGILGTSMGVDAIAEFQTLTNTYGAQFGGNGSVVNEVSKSGTNSFHGSAYEFLRNSALDARNFFDPPKITPFKRNQFGGTLGGPIKKDKMFFFTNYEGLRQSLGETLQYTVLDAQARNGFLPNSAGVYVPAVPGKPGNVAPSVLPYLNFYSEHVPLPSGEILKNGLPTGTGTIIESGNQPGSENYVLARYDWTISSKDSFFIRYLNDVANLTEPFSGAFALWPTKSRDHNQFATLEEKHIITNNLINTAHFGYSRPLETLTTPVSYPLFQYFPGAGLPDGRIVITGLTSPFEGGIRQNPLRLMQNKFAYGDDVLWTKGAHTLRLGGLITRVQTGAIQDAPGGGEWDFNSPLLFLQGTASQYGGPTPGSSVVLTDGTVIGGTNGQRDFREIDYAAYVQDDWKMFPTFTFNIGVRYDPTSNPYCLKKTTPYCTAVIPPPFGQGATGAITTGFTQVHNIYVHNPSFGNLDPRIGFAWDPFKNHKTSVRAGYGIFHAVIAARDFEPAYALTPPWAITTELNGTFPIIAAVQTGLTVANGFSPYVDTTPVQQQWNLTVQHEIMKNTVLSIGYVGSHGTHLLVSRDDNPPIPTINPADGNLQFSTLQNGKIVSNPLINKNFSYIDQSESTGWSKYNALQAGFVRRLTNNLQGQISYTYSECTDIGSGSFGLDAGTNFQNPYSPNDDRGWCAFHVRHNLVLNSMYTLPFHGNKLVDGWQLSGIFTHHTGVPVNVTDGFIQAFQNGTTANRPNRVPGDCNPVNKNPEQPNGVFWINPACFTLPPVGELGNVARNYVIGPSAIDLDAAITKYTSINERIKLQFRAEFFNVLNNVNFGQPGGAIFTQGTNGGGTPSATAGQVTSTGNYTSRQIQFGLKLLF